MSVTLIAACRSVGRGLSTNDDSPERDRVHGALIASGEDIEDSRRSSSAIFTALNVEPPGKPAEAKAQGEDST